MNVLSACMRYGINDRKQTRMEECFRVRLKPRNPRSPACVSEKLGKSANQRFGWSFKIQMSRKHHRPTRLASRVAQKPAPLSPNPAGQARLDFLTRSDPQPRVGLEQNAVPEGLALGAGNICWECSSYASTPSFDFVHIYFFRNSTRGSRSNRKDRCGDECEHQKTGGGTHCSLQQN